MLILLLHELWNKYAADILPRRPEDTMRFNTFAVNDIELADKIRRWIGQDRQSKEAIQKHLNDLVPFYYRIAPMQYTCDYDGRLDCISFSGIIPEGWAPVSERSSVLKPVSPAAISAVNALPLSSRQDLHDLINWPTIEENWLPNEQHFFARQVNRLVRIEEKSGRIYIYTPHPENFKESSPLISRTLYGWKMPDALRRMEAPSGP
jgi:hypothetical protein